MNEIRDDWSVTINANDSEPISGQEISKKIINYIINDESIFRIMIRNMSIFGCISLVDASATGKIIPTLVFSGCDIETLDIGACECGRLYIENTKIRVFRAIDTKFLYGIHLNNVEFKTYSEGCPLPQFNIYGSDIEGDLIIENISFLETSCGSLQFNNINLSGACKISHCRIESCLNMSGCKIQCDLNISDSHLHGTLHLINSFIDGHFRTERCEKIGNGLTAIDGEGLEVGGAVLLWSSNFEGCLHIIQADIGVNLELKSCSLALARSARNSVAYFNGSEVKGQFIVENVKFDGGLSINNAQIGKSIDITKSKFFSDSPREFYLINTVNCRVGGSFTISASNVQAGICMDGLSCERSAVLYDVAFRPTIYFEKVRQQETAFIALRNSEIKSVLSFSKINRQGCITVGADGARIGELQVDQNFCDHVVCYMQGTVFDRFSVDNDSKISQMLQILVTAADYSIKSTKSINLQPFVHFSDHLRQSGRSSEADRVLIEMKRLMRRSTKPSVKKALSWIYDKSFGYGLSVKKSVFTSIVWIILGTIGTFVALERNILVIDLQAVSSTVPQLKPGVSVQPTLPIAPQDGALGVNLPCGDAIDPFFYAVELVLPIFDFGQKKQCTVRGREPSDSTFWLVREYVWWLFAKYTYTVLGWVIISLTVLTALGVIRDRNSSPG